MIWGNREAEYFCAEDSTETMRDLPVGQHKGLGVMRLRPRTFDRRSVTGVTAAGDGQSQIGVVLAPEPPP